MLVKQLLICPNCKSTLSQVGKTYKCENQHSFDVSKEGYLNLLIANKKSKTNPGDNKLMMDARDAFLSEGHYDFLMEKIEVSMDYLDTFNLPDSETSCMLDIGCGSGYYTRNLLDGYSDVHRIGIDISKQGVAKASKRDKESTYIVGSVFDLPIAGDSADIILNIFSPISLTEATRVLKPGGIIIKVIPGSDHMKEVAELVYKTFKPHVSSIEMKLSSVEELEVINIIDIDKVTDLHAADLHNCIRMTPYLYKFREGALEKLSKLSLTLSFKVIVAQYNRSAKLS